MFFPPSSSALALLMAEILDVGEDFIGDVAALGICVVLERVQSRFGRGDNIGSGAVISVYGENFVALNTSSKSSSLSILGFTYVGTGESSSNFLGLPARFSFFGVPARPGDVRFDNELETLAFLLSFGDLVEHGLDLKLFQVSSQPHPHHWNSRN